jgi:uncharacterized membrane protein
MRPQLGLEPAPEPTLAAGLDLPRAPQAVVDVAQTRCVVCHAPAPVWDGIGIAPKGVMLDTPERIAALAPAIRIQAVLTHAMPPNNLTDMTDAERRALGHWLAAASLAGD